MSTVYCGRLDFLGDNFNRAITWNEDKRSESKCLLSIDLPTNTVVETSYCHPAIITAKSSKKDDYTGANFNEKKRTGHYSVLVPLFLYLHRMCVTLHFHHECLRIIFTWKRNKNEHIHRFYVKGDMRVSFFLKLDYITWVQTHSHIHIPTVWQTWTVYGSCKF